MNIPNCTTASFMNYNNKMENSAMYVSGTGKLYPITDLSESNGFSIPRKNVTINRQPAFKNKSLPPLSKPNKEFVSCTNYEKNSSINESLLSPDQSCNAIRYIEREMPNLIRESDTDQRSSLLTGSTVFNQRYQNVRQFPNYRQRKKGAFERKLKRCGLELDGELTISILRQFLQPFIYRDINSILDEYIKKYFMKAFENIRENINITSENWSQIIKCSISKSLYKQYCTNATIDPFDPISADQTDFPCFPNLCKVSTSTNQKSSTASTDVFAKSDIYDSTVPDIASDNNSELSNCSDHYDINQIDITSSTNRCCTKLNPFPYPDQESDKNTNNYLFRKRQAETNKMCDKSKIPNLKDSHDFDGSSHKFPKKMHSVQPINHCHASNLLGHSNDFPSTNQSQLQTPNNYQSLPNNLSKISYDQIDPRTAPFENKNISFFKDNSLNVSLLRAPSQSAIQPDNYLNRSHNSVENNDSNNRYFQST